jgi:hypothetical protein
LANKHSKIIKFHKDTKQYLLLNMMKRKYSICYYKTIKNLTYISKSVKLNHLIQIIILIKCYMKKLLQRYISISCVCIYWVWKPLLMIICRKLEFLYFMLWRLLLINWFKRYSRCWMRDIIIEIGLVCFWHCSKIIKIYIVQNNTFKETKSCYSSQSICIRKFNPNVPYNFNHITFNPYNSILHKNSNHFI